MKVNPNYLGRLFTEKELTEEERQEAVRRLLFLLFIYFRFTIE